MQDISLIQNKILEIRGQRVLLDRDIASMYGVETKVLNQAVKRNLERFPEDFMFQLTEDENTALRSQIVTLKNGRGQHSKYTPYAFTELGVAMLSSVLRSPIAIQVNMAIMRAFVLMRQKVTEARETPIAQLEKKIDKLAAEVEDILRDQNDTNEELQMQIDCVSQALADLQANNKTLPPRRRIGYITDS